MLLRTTHPRWGGKVVLLSLGYCAPCVRALKWVLENAALPQEGDW